MFGFTGICLAKGSNELQHRKRKSKNVAYLVFTVTGYQKETLPKFLRKSLLKNVSIYQIKGLAYLESFGNLGAKPERINVFKIKYNVKDLFYNYYSFASNIQIYQLVYLITKKSLCTWPKKKKKKLN